MSKADYEIVASWMEVVWVTVIMFLSTKLSNNVQNAISIVNNCKSFLLLHQQPEYPSPRFDSRWKKLSLFTEYPLNTQDVLRAPRKLEMDEGNKFSTWVINFLPIPASSARVVSLHAAFGLGWWTRRKTFPFS